MAWGRHADAHRAGYLSSGFHLCRRPRSQSGSKGLLHSDLQHNICRTRANPTSMRRWRTARDRGIRRIVQKDHRDSNSRDRDEFPIGRDSGDGTEHDRALRSWRSVVPPACKHPEAANLHPMESDDRLFSGKTLECFSSRCSSILCVLRLSRMTSRAANSVAVPWRL